MLPMSLSTRCQSAFSSKTCTRGRSYANNGRVSFEYADANSIEAFVRGSYGDYTVRLERDADGDKLLHVTCNCPHFEDGNLCKHIWATILKSEKSEEPLAIPGNGRIVLEPHFLEGDGWDDWGDDEDPFEFGEQIFDGQGRRKTSSRRWQQTFSNVVQETRRQQDFLPQSLDREAEAWFVIDLAASQQTNCVVVNLKQRERKKNGNWGKIKKLSFDITQINCFPDPNDRSVLQQLYLARRQTSSYSYSSRYDDDDYATGNTVTLRTDAALQTLMLLVAHPRFSATLDGNPPKENDAGPLTVDIDPDDPGSLYHFRLCFDRDDDNEEYVIRGEFFRGDEVVPLDDPMLVSTGGVLLMPDRLCAHEANGEMGWIAELRKENAIRIPFDDGDAAMEKLWQSNAVPKTQLPDELNWERVEGVPRPRLRIVEQTGRPKYYGSDNELDVHVEFLYEDRVVLPESENDALVDSSNRRAIVRNHEKESEFLDQLTPLPLHELYQYSRSVEAPDFILKTQNVAKVVEHLAAKSWIVEAEGKLVRSAGEFDINVTTGIDWFDVTATIDYGDVSAQLPELLKAMRDGDNTVTLSDGSQGLINADWLEKYRNLADLAEAKDGKLRFRKTQALLLDALLAAQPQASFDRQFTAFRKKLQAFDGIEPQSEPRGFQGELRGYQQNGLGWMRFLTEFRFGGCLADDMGLGKTVQVLALLQTRRLRRGTKDEPKRPSIAVVPKSLIFNWIDEAARFTPTLNVVNYTGGDRKTELAEAGDYDLLITTYGTLRRDIAELKDTPFDYAILDESQAIKNAKSQSAKACRLINATHRLAMTGTPIENHLGELWSQFEFLNPGMLGQSSAFQRLTKQTAQNPDALKALQKAIAPFILRRTKSQVLTDLPEKVEQTLHCELVGKQRKQYDELRKHYRDSLTKRINDDGLKNSKIHVLEALLRLRQAACHPALVDPKQKRARSAKFDVLLEQVEEVLAEGHKALVFSQFTTLLSILKTKLDTAGHVYEYLDGKTSNRKKCVERFQTDADCKLFLISLKAGGHGLNLTEADYVFILDPWWNPAVESQAVDRAHRIGQQRKVFAYRLIARDTVEEKILQLQQQKRDLADAVITANESLIQKLTAEDLELLLS